MSLLEAPYIPPDRLHALAAGTPIPSTAEGSAIFADISGFTPVTEKLQQVLGARRGAELVATHLNRVYDALIKQVESYDGSIISFAGDAITGWFVGEDSIFRATACAFALIEAMQSIEQITLPDNRTYLIGLKVSIAHGAVRRLVVGDPAIQQIDTLAGSTIARMAAGEHVAARGEVVADTFTVERLGAAAQVSEWRESDGERFAVLERMAADSRAADIPKIPEQTSRANLVLRPWLLPAIVSHFEAGMGEYLTELRPAVALFVRFTGLDYDGDPEVETKLDGFVRLVQKIVTRYEGNVLQLTIGDKGSYLYAAFGAPFAHEDDVTRALDAALDIRGEAASLDYLGQTQIGISRGTMRTGAYGSETRRTYGVLGDEANLAARLMMEAAPGEILLSEKLIGAKLDGYVLEKLVPLRVKGKANPVEVFRLIERREQTFAQRFYTTPLIGRDRELAAVRAAIQPIFEGRHAGVITIYGDPGMGKSRLAFEVQARLQAEAQVTWLMGQADALNRAPFKAFSYFLRPSFGQQREHDYTANLAAFDTQFEDLLALSDEDNRADLQQYRSYLAGIVGLVIPGSAYETADEIQRIDTGLTALKAWARAQSRRQPLVLHLEDAQWLDAVSIRAVQDLTYNMEYVPLVLLLTSRHNDDGTPFIIPNIFSVPIQNIDLAHLSSNGVREIVEAVLGGDVSETIAAFIRERAEGNPFFTEQLALDLCERGVLIEQEGGWTIRADSAADVPSNVNAVLIARLDRLSSQVKVVVQTASVLGREFDVQILSRMLRENERHYIQVAEAEAIWSAMTALRYLFRHVLLRDAAYQMQVQERIIALHRLAAETIEQLYPDDAMWHDVLLEHWHAAGDVDRELRYLDPVVERLIQVVAEYDRAEQLVKRTLEQLAENDTRRAAPLNWMSLVHLKRNNFAEARSTAMQVRALISPGDRAVLAVSLYLSGATAIRESKFDEARAYLEQSLEIYRETDDLSGIATNLQQLGECLRAQGAYAEARPPLEQSLEIRRKLGDYVGIGRSLAILGTVARFQGKYAEARTYMEQSLAIRREIGNRPGIGDSLAELGIIARLQGNYGEAREYHEQGLAIRRDIGDRVGMSNSLIGLGNIAFAQGAYTEARSAYEHSLAALREIGEPAGIAGNLNNLGVITAVQGDYEASEAYHQESLAIRRNTGDRRGIADSLNNLGALAFRQEDYQAAEPYFRESLAMHRELKDGFIYSSQGWLGRAQIRLGQVHEARNSLREAFRVLHSDDVAHKFTLLVLAAEIHWQQNDLEAAAELAGLILSHPSTESESRDDIEAMLSDIRSRLDSSRLDTALERGKTLQLDAVVTAILSDPS